MLLLVVRKSQDGMQMHVEFREFECITYDVAHSAHSIDCTPAAAQSARGIDRTHAVAT